MAKKTTLLLIVSVLLIAMFAFVACKQNPIVPPSPDPLEPVENEDGEHSANLIPQGDFETGIPYPFIDDGSAIEVVDGAGRKGSNALSVDQQKNYGQTYLDITAFYGRGKSYYVEAWFKDDGSTKKDDFRAHLSFTVVSGAVQDAVASHSNWEDYYDCDDIYEGGWLSDAAAETVFDMTTNNAGAMLDIETEDGWHKVAAVLDAETIDKLLADTTAKYAPGTEQTIEYLLIGFFLGDYNNGGQDGYKFLLDDVVIIDLNKELDVEGKTYNPGGDDPDDPVDPNA